MLGAIIGDIVGSRFEWDNIKSKNFDFFLTSEQRSNNYYLPFRPRHSLA